MLSSASTNVILKFFQDGASGVNNIYKPLEPALVPGYGQKKDPDFSESFPWCGAGLNRRHKDFQSFALPTELPHHPSTFL